MGRVAPARRVAFDDLLGRLADGGDRDGAAPAGVAAGLGGADVVEGGGVRLAERDTGWPPRPMLVMWLWMRMRWQPVLDAVGHDAQGESVSAAVAVGPGAVVGLDGSDEGCGLITLSDHWSEWSFRDG